MPTETEARQALRKLLDDYGRLSPDERAQMTEASVVRQFIDRLLRDVLGWPVEDPARYKYEQVTQAGRPDIMFVPEAGGTIFVEAKRFGAIKELKQARTTIAGVITPGQLALPGMAVDRTEEEQQAINYAFANNGTWAILTNFEKLRLFNARRDWLVLSFETPAAYLDEFDQLWQLAYHNILNGSLERLSNQRYTRDVDTEYLNFINHWRERLAQDIVQRRAQNPWAFHDDGSINLPLLRAVVQRFLDRLVIVRFAEDHLVIPPGTLRQYYDLCISNPYTFTMDEFLDRFFRRFNTEHDSALFAEGLVDQASFSDEVLLPLISKLYEARYRSMPADIIGNTYEQYLGKTLALDNGRVITRDNLETRKKQGSYYTPQPIVRYLVDTTLGRYLYGTANGQPDGEPVPGETRKTSRDIRDLKVLDAACGSGSFLIYAYYVLADFYEGEIRRLQAEMEARNAELAAQGVSPIDRRLELADYTVELERIRDYPRLILETHLYGVDLDPQAAEIAVVNLIMRAMERRQQEKRLPHILNQNIKVGNSLVGLRPFDPRLAPHADAIARLRRMRLELLRTPDGPEHEALLRGLEEETRQLTAVLDADFLKYFTDLERTHPFHWGIEFPEVFYGEDGQPLDNPGFTVVIGNPPYGAYLSSEERMHLRSQFDAGTTDTAALMMLQNFALTSSGGFNGMIVPKPFVYASSWKQVRDLLLRDIVELVDCGRVWEDVKLEQTMYVLKKAASTGSYRSLQKLGDNVVFLAEIDKAVCATFGFYLHGVTEAEIELGQKLIGTGQFLGDCVTNTRGAALQNVIDTNLVSGRYVVGGKEIQPFHIVPRRGWLRQGVDVPNHAVVKPNSILVQNIVAHIQRPIAHVRIIGAVAEAEMASQIVILDTVNQLSNLSSYSSYYLLGLLSSKVINWFIYRFVFGKAIRTMHFDGPVTSRIPIPNLDLANPVDEEFHDELSLIVKELTRESMLSQNAKRIARLRNDMDEIVYRLFALEQSEIRIIEKAMP